MLLNPSNELSPCTGQHPAFRMLSCNETSELKLFYHSLRYRAVNIVADDDQGIALRLGEIFGHLMKKVTQSDYQIADSDDEFRRHGLASLVVDAGTLLPQLAFFTPAVFPAITNAKTKVCCYVNHARNVEKGAPS